MPIKSPAQLTINININLMMGKNINATDQSVTTTQQLDQPNLKIKHGARKLVARHTQCIHTHAHTSCLFVAHRKQKRLIKRGKGHSRYTHVGANPESFMTLSNLCTQQHKQAKHTDRPLPAFFAPIDLLPSIIYNSKIKIYELGTAANRLHQPGSASIVEIKFVGDPGRVEHHGAPVVGLVRGNNRGKRSEGQRPSELSETDREKTPFAAHVRHKIQQQIQRAAAKGTTDAPPGGGA